MIRGRCDKSVWGSRKDCEILIIWVFWNDNQIRKVCITMKLTESQDWTYSVCAELSFIMKKKDLKMFNLWSFFNDVISCSWYSLHTFLIYHKIAAMQKDPGRGPCRNYRFRFLSGVVYPDLFRQFQRYGADDGTWTHTSCARYPLKIVRLPISPHLRVPTTFIILLSEPGFVKDFSKIFLRASLINSVSLWDS